MMPLWQSQGGLAGLGGFVRSTRENCQIRQATEKDTYRKVAETNPLNSSNPLFRLTRMYSRRLRMSSPHDALRVVATVGKQTLLLAEAPIVTELAVPAEPEPDLERSP